MDTAPAAVRPPQAAPTERPPVRAWLQPILIALVVVSAFISCYVGLARAPQPHRLPVAVVGSHLSAQIQQALGDSIDVHSAPSVAAADQALRHRDVAGVLVPEGAGDLYLEVAGANGPSTTGAVKSLISAYGHGAGSTVTVKDVVPLTQYDSRGFAAFYVAFGVTLSGFALAQSILGLSQLLHLRHRFTVMAGFAVIAGVVAATLAGPVLGAVPAPFPLLAVTLALLAAAAAFTTKLLGTYFGPVGVPLATLLLLTIGNATSGATIGEDLLPGVAHSVSGILPPGAAVRAITNLSYFDGAHTLVPLLCLAAWAVCSALLVWGRSTYRATQSRQA
ncbi:hypothetical protein [Streptomyces sp. NPDC059861]|uniref:hypothetical protein n=1 Tax=Streptomyces sp. NPDC059861 TaxID=3346974 RepID=UPI0036578169